MRSPLKRLLPILFAILIIFSIFWYLFVYDKEFTKDFLLSQARFFEKNGNHTISAWLYNQAYLHSDHSKEVAIELAEQYKESGNYTKAEYTLSQAIANKPSAELYTALCQIYVEQNKLLDAVTMLENVTDPQIKAQLDALRPARPTANPDPGFYSQYIHVTVDAEADLYVTANGEYPSVETDLYTSEITLPVGENTIHAVCVGENGLVSELAIFSYTIGGVIEEVTLISPELDTHIRQLLGFDAEDRILTSDLWNITSLTIPHSVIDYSDLRHFTKLTELTIDKGNFSDLGFLSDLTALTTLSITNTPVSTGDLKTIAALPALTQLTLANCGLGNIENLSTAKLTYLDLSNNAIRDLSPLSFMSTLSDVNLSFNAIKNLNALSALTGMKVLDVSGNSLSSMRPLASCVNLQELNVAYNSISSLSGLENLTAMTTLDASNNELTEVEALSGLTSLKTLLLNNNTILNITSLSGLTALEHFDFSYNEIEALPIWSGNSALVYIDGSNNKLTSINNLSTCKNLNTVLMNYNNISSVAALSTCRKLVRVDVSGNPVTNVSVLTDSGVIVNWDPV